MTAYHETTPLMSNAGATSHSHSDLEGLTSVQPARLDAQRRSQRQTEFHLSIDKVDSLYSPKERQHRDAIHPSFATAEDEFSVLDPYFDVTAARLQSAFEDAEPDDENRLSYESFRVALESVGIRCTDDDAFEKLVHSVDRGETGLITFEQFEQATQKLKLVHLLDETIASRFMMPRARDPAPGTSQITVSDFSSKQMQQFHLQRREFREFFTSKRPQWVSVRWVNLDCQDSLNLKRLAIKYRLHPLAVEDTLEMNGRPKFDHYDDHLFLAVPVLTLETGDGFKKQSSGALHTKRSSGDRLSQLVNRERSQSGGVLPSDEPFRVTVDYVAIFVVGDNTVITVDGGNTHHVFQELTRRLTVPYSKLRHNDAKFLVYAVLDVIVDHITKVVDDITDHLMGLEDDLSNEKHKFDITRTRHVKNEVFRLPQLLKPMKEMLKNLMDSSDFDQNSTLYIRDVHDHVAQVLDSIGLQLHMVRLMNEDHRDSRANHMNYVMYTLTIVTTIFMPAQFLTGVFGMNFQYMTIFQNPYGYPIFWIAVFVNALAFLVYFRYKKWI